MGSKVVFLLQLLLLVSLASASHNFGGTMTFTAKGRNPDGTFRVDLRYRSTLSGCQYSHGWNHCYNGNCGTTASLQRGRIDSGTNVPGYRSQWCETQTVMTRNVPSDKPFTIREASCCWINTRNSLGSWILLTNVDMGTRSDTERPNRSPDVDILPFLRVPMNCPRTYNLMAFDPDDDQVRCRYGTNSPIECSRCSQPPGFRLDQGSCTLHYVGTTNTGVYGFELVVEDFPNRPITLAYSDGHRSARYPLTGRRGRRAVYVTSVSYPWWWTPQSSTTPPTGPPNSTPPPTPTTNPYWWQWRTSAYPQTTSNSNWWGWWRQQQQTSTPPPTTTSPPTTTTNPYWWQRRTSAYPGANWYWWQQQQQQTSTPPPTSTTTNTTATSTPWWLGTTTTQRPTTSTRQRITWPQASTAPLSKLPLQFSLLVDGAAPSCNEGMYLPRFLPPTPRNGERLRVEVNTEVEIRVKAQATHSRLQGIIMSGPLNITKHRTTQEEYVIKWSPVPDDLGDYFPICFAVESITRYGSFQSEMRCVIVEVIQQNVTAHVICTETTMTVEVEKSSFKGLHEDHLRLSDPSNTICSLQRHSNSTHVIAVIPLNACGTQIEEDDENLIFKNEITTVDNIGDIITRKHLLEVEFGCIYPKLGNVTLGFTAHRNNVTVKEKGFGTFTYQFEFYHTDHFDIMIDPNSYPLEFEIGNKIFMEIEATSAVNNTELFVESCRAAPYDNPNYRPMYTIIEDGCKVDQTVEIYSPRHQKHFQFSMDAFKFIGLHDQVYISCSVMVCEAGNPATRCSQGCINSTSSRYRQKREAVIQTTPHFVSQGPLRLRRSPESAVTNLNLNLVFIAGCLLAAVAMISAVVIYKSKASTVKYQHLPSFES